MDTTTLTKQNKGRRVYDGRTLKTVASFGTKNGPSGKETLLVNFTDGTWAYAEMVTPA